MLYAILSPEYYIYNQFISPLLLVLVFFSGFLKFHKGSLNITSRLLFSCMVLLLTRLTTLTVLQRSSEITKVCLLGSILMEIRDSNHSCDSSFSEEEL